MRSNTFFCLIRLRTDTLVSQFSIFENSLFFSIFQNREILYFEKNREIKIEKFSILKKIENSCSLFFSQISLFFFKIEKLKIENFQKQSKIENSCSLFFPKKLEKNREISLFFSIFQGKKSEKYDKFKHFIIVKMDDFRINIDPNFRPK